MKSEKKTVRKADKKNQPTDTALAGFESIAEMLMAAAKQPVIIQREKVESDRTRATSIIQRYLKSVDCDWSGDEKTQVRRWYASAAKSEDDVLAFHELNDLSGLLDHAKASQL